MLEAGLPIKVIMDLGAWKTEEEFFKYIKIKKRKTAEIAANHPFFK